MHEFKKLVRFDWRTSGVEAENAIMLCRPIKLVGRDVPGPATQMGNFLRLRQALLTLAQRVLGLLALGDVDNESVISNDIFFEVEIGNQSGMKIPISSFGVNHGLLVADLFAGKRALNIFFNAAVVLRSDEIDNLPPQNRRLRHLKPLLKISIDEPVALLRINIGDQCRNIVRYQPQAFLAFAQRLFGLCKFGDVMRQDVVAADGAVRCTIRNVLCMNIGLASVI